MRLTVDEKGWVSVWIGVDWFDRNDPAEQHCLKDLFGIEYYDEDAGEGNASDDLELIPVADLIRPLSFSESFLDEAVNKAKAMGITEGRWVTVLYDYRYDYAEIVGPVASDPKYIGRFRFVANLDQ